MKQSWGIKTLGEVCEIMNGGTPDTTEPKFWDGDNLWITPKDMGKLESIYVDNTLRKITDEGLKNSSAKILPVNSIILSSRAPIGHLAINTNPMSTNQGCKGLVPRNGISALYLYYFLSKSVDLLNSLGTGATFKELSSSKLGTVEIPLPPLPEQQRIVAILDDAFEAIATAKTNAEQNLKNTKELFASYLHGVFENKGKDWQEKTLQEIVDERCTLSYGIVQPGEEFPNGIPVIRPTDLISKFISLKGLKLIDPRLAQSYKRTTLMGNELLLCVRGNTGVISIATSELKSANVTRGIVPICFKPHILKLEFGYYQFISDFIMKQIKGKTYGAALMQINIGDLRKVTILIPSLSEQQTIVTKLDALSAETKRLEAIYQQKIADLEELKKSILQMAFNGEL